jgi:hypothetical protein
MKYIKPIYEFLNENNNYNDFYIIYDNDKIVYHITSKNVANDIIKNGFKTGYELNISEKRKAIYFSDLDVNYGLYARNKEGELYAGDEIGEVPINIKGLKLLNMTYKENGIFINHKKYNSLVVQGELDKIPYNIDGTISFLEDGKIYEVALKKDIANKAIIKNDLINENKKHVLNIHDEFIDDLKKELSKFKTDEELLRKGGLSDNLLYRLAFGFAEEDISTLMPNDLKIK